MLSYLRCSAGGNEGWGNLFRLLIIREYLLKQLKSKVILIINANKKIKNFLIKRKISFLNLNKKNLEFEKKIVDKLNKSDLTIIEMLNPSLRLQNIYKRKSNKVVVLDDILENKYKVDLLISCQKTSKKPIISKKTNFNSGYEYFPFRNEFNIFFNKKKKIKKKIKDITIFLGGSSYEKFNYKVAERLKDYNGTRFILGGELNLKFKKKLLGINKTFKILQLPKNLAEILFKSDLVISGGGYSKIETAAVGTPQISVAIHKHQVTLLKNFKKKFKTKYIIFKNIDDLNKIIEGFNFNKRILESKNYKNFFSQNGLEKIFQKIVRL
jgi:spore coat polysaccharide biosynthesis predicted glycosyltransferase SpsG